MSQIIRLASALGAFMMAFITPAAVADEAPLRVGMIPDAGATQVSIEEKAPLQKYLSEKLGRPVKLIIPTNYNATVEALGNGSLDVAYLGGLTYVKAHARYGAVPLVQRDIDRQFHSLFITGATTGIKTLADLKGKRFCFGDINSTSGHLMPELVLHDAGLDPKTDFASFRYTGSHPATAQAVAVGVCDAGAIDETVFHALVNGGKIAADKVTVFFKTQPFADYVWAAREGLSDHDREAFATALLSLKKGRDDAILKILRGETFLRASNSSYVGIAKTAKALGLQ